METHRQDRVWYPLQGAVLAQGLLILGKLAVGFSTGAVSMIADGLHSGMNLVSTSTAYTAIRRKNTFADTVRQYGEAQADHILSSLEALLLIVVSCLIFAQSIGRMETPQIMPALVHWGLAVMVISTLAHAVLAQVLQREAVRHESAELYAGGMASRHDVWLSAFLVTGFAVMEITGWLWLDAVLACVVSIHLLYSAVTMLRTHYNGFHTVPLSDIEKHRIGRIILDNPGVLGYHNLQVRTEHAVMKLYFHLEVSKELPSYQVAAVSDAVSMSLLLKYGPCAPSIHVDRR